MVIDKHINLLFRQFIIIIIVYNMRHKIWLCIILGINKLCIRFYINYQLKLYNIFTKKTIVILLNKKLYENFCNLTNNIHFNILLEITNTCIFKLDKTLIAGNPNLYILDKLFVHKIKIIYSIFEKIRVKFLFIIRFLY